MCVLWSAYTISEYPLEDQLLNTVEFINNLLYWFTLLDCYNLTPQNDIDLAKKICGWIFNGLIFILIGLNVVYMFY